MRETAFAADTITYHIDGSGPGLVLLHGTGGDAESTWGHLVPELAQGWTVVRPEYSGSGGTRDDGGPLTVDKLAGQVVAVARAAGAVPFHLVGFSLGAAVAVAVAAEHPSLVRSLVLLSGFASSDDPRQKTQFELWRHLARDDHVAMARLILTTGFSPGFVSALGEAGIAEAIGQIVETTRWDGMTRQIQLDMKLDVTAQARCIASPTLVIGCTLDQMVPSIQARHLASLIPVARYAEMETGHIAQIEQPAEFLALLTDFLRQPQA